MQIINLWRPIKGPLLDSPLAVCDARTVKPGDLVPSDLVYPHRIGETYSVKYNPEHQWFYVPNMTADEILLLKCFDSKTDGRARFAPHTAFADPTTPSDAPPRESIELRTLVFHKKKAMLFTPPRALARGGRGRRRARTKRKKGPAEIFRLRVDSVRCGCRCRKAAIDRLADIERLAKDAVSGGAIRGLLDFLDDGGIDHDRAGLLRGVGAEQHVFRQLGQFGGVPGVFGRWSSDHSRALFSRCTRSCTAARLVAMAWSEATMKVMVGVRPSPSAMTLALSLSVA